MKSDFQESDAILKPALVVGFLLLPFFPALNVSADIGLSSLRVFILAGGIVWFAGALFRRRVRIPLAPTTLAFTAFVFVAATSVVWAQDPSVAERKIIFLLSLFPAIFLVSASEAFHERLLKAFMCGAAFSAALAMFLFSLQFFFSGQWVAGHIARAAPLFLGFSVADVVSLFPSWFVDIGAGNPLLRAFFPFPDPHTAALFWGMALAIALAIANPKFEYRNPKRNYLTWCGVTILVLAIVATFSRGAYVALFVLLIAYSVWQIAVNRVRATRYTLYAICLATLFVITSSLLAPALYGRFLQIFNLNEGSSVGRLLLWHEAIDVFAQHPLIGSGLGNYAVAVNPFAPYRIPTNAHSTYLEIAAELGVVGLSLFLFALGSAVALARRFAKDGSYLHQAVFFALIFFSAHAVFETDLYSPANLVVFLTLLTIAGLSPEKKLT